MELAELFGELRGVLEEPGPHAWRRMIQVLSAFDDALVLEEVVMPYLFDRLRSWDRKIPRLAPTRWYSPDLSPERRRALNSLALAPCPECRKGWDHADVSRSLKASYGKDYTNKVKVRDVMTGKGPRVEWRCPECRGVKCPVCDEPVTFADLVQALLKLHGAHNQPRQLANAIMIEKKSVAWCCDACQEKGVDSANDLAPAPKLGRGKHRTRRESRRRGGAPARVYVDRRATCRECSAPFVFTAAEQRVWYEEYRIPTHAPGAFGGTPIVKVRCNACQRRRMVHKRLNHLVPNHDPDDPAQLRQLSELYEEIESEQKAAEFRNRARKLEEV